MLSLSVPAARNLLLAAQGLTSPLRRKARKEDVLAMIRRMGALQIDTISVVARSPYLVLWSRLGSYDPRWLEELLAEGKIFEYWSHAACFLPIEDVPLYEARMAARAQRSQEWMTENRELVEGVLARMREKGTVRSADWKRAGGESAGWWDWKPEKRALEHLFASGTVTVSHRSGFQRVYGLREQVHGPAGDNAQLDPETVRRAFVTKTVRALGIAIPAWVPNYFGLRTAGIAATIQELTSEGELLEASIDGCHEKAYVHRDHLALATEAATDGLRSRVTTLISPFDPLVWHRERALRLFDFSYRIETYTPAAKRRYGYFTLPILHRGALVGRLDPKAHRKEGVLEIKAVHLEPRMRVTERLRKDVTSAINRFASWQGLGKVAVTGLDAIGLERWVRVPQ